MAVSRVGRHGDQYDLSRGCDGEGVARQIIRGAVEAAKAEAVRKRRYRHNKKTQ